jgi:hypothetical protein
MSVLENGGYFTFTWYTRNTFGEIKAHVSKWWKAHFCVFHHFSSQYIQPNYQSCHRFVGKKVTSSLFMKNNLRYVEMNLMKDKQLLF